MVEFVQGVRYGLVGVGCVFSFAVGLMVLALFGSALTALGDWLNGGEDGNEGQDDE